MVKNLLVSDYDGTYITNSKEMLEQNNSEIKKFMLNGNSFVLSTGRIFYDIIDELKKNNIIFNYLCCSNGNSIFNEKLDLIKFIEIKYADIIFLEKFYKYIDSIESFDSYGEKTKKNITEFRIKYKDLKSKEIITKYMLDNKIYNYYHNINNSLILHIFNYYTNKSNAVSFISKKELILKENIYSIGDGYNDSDIILDFNGYSVPNAKKYVKSIALGEYASVASLVKSIEEGSVMKRWKKYIV